MACFHPVKAWLTAAGEVVFAEVRGHDYVKTLELPCGQCVGCRIERSRQWAIRCLHESKLYEENCFVTLTYNDRWLPEGNTFYYRHFQLFMKALRRRAGSRTVRFFVAGEYGEQDGRPHYHALLFNWSFKDQKYFKKSPSGHGLYTSELCSVLWPYGYHWIGNVSFESAQYVAKYCMKKVNGDLAEAHYAGRLPEFACMSRRPGIGEPWVRKYFADIKSGEVAVNGKMVKIPRYYDVLLADGDGDAFDVVQYKREKLAKARYWDNTDERLAVREKVVSAGLVFNRNR